MKLDIGGIYVISLDSRPERWNLFLEGLASWETAFGKRPERLSAVAGVSLLGYDEKPWFTGRISERRKKSWGGKAGCILSHRNAIQMAADQNWSHALIVEDDAFLADEMAQAWKHGLKQLVEALPDDWSAVYLCTTDPISPCRVAAEHQGIKLVEAGGAFGTVAYLLNGRVFEPLLEELPDEKTIWGWVARHKTIDRWFSRNLMRFGRVYAFAPSIVGHREGPSDITMTPEAKWEFDFTLKDIRFVRNGVYFLVLRVIRYVGNVLRNFFSVFRLLTKRLRGL